MFVALLSPNSDTTFCDVNIAYKSVHAPRYEVSRIFSRGRSMPCVLIMKGGGGRRHIKRNIKSRFLYQDLGQTLQTTLPTASGDPAIPRLDAHHPQGHGVILVVPITANECVVKK